MQCNNYKTRKSRYTPEQASFARLYQRYKVDAKRRGIDFNLDLDTVCKIVKQDCHYCGSPPSLKINGYCDYDGTPLKKSTNLERIELAWVNFNGMDRMDSRLGYTEDNVVPCCCICNVSKSNHSYEYFIEYLKRLAQFNKQVSLQKII